MKARRHNAILEIVRKGDVASQDELIDKLKDRGIEVSQSTLSRDIQELELAKAGGVYAVVGHEPARIAATPESLHRIFREFVTDVILAQGLVVIKTGPGSASPVAQALDDAGWSEPVGTIAGENTIFVAVRSEREGARLVRRILGLLK